MTRYRIVLYPHSKYPEHNRYAVEIKRWYGWRSAFWTYDRDGSQVPEDFSSFTNADIALTNLLYPKTCHPKVLKEVTLP